MRQLSEFFIKNLKNESGIIFPILERVKNDDTLMFAIRDGYINIYYRGGSLLKITEHNNSFSTSFDHNYIKSGMSASDLRIPSNIDSVDAAQKCVQAFPHIKEVMDLYFSKNNKPEREYQQLVARENNYSTISNESEYFIADIEVAETEFGARFDMIGIKWPANQRQKGNKCTPVFIEMKYGDGAVGGTSGLVKHLKDFNDFIEEGRYSSLLASMENQFDQLDELGLLKFNKSGNVKNISFDTNKKLKPEVILILANHNPRSTSLSTELNKPEVLNIIKEENFDLKFFVASFSGYGMHHDCMLNLESFLKLLKDNKTKDNNK